MIKKVYIGYAFLAAYFIGMLVYPIIQTCFDWPKTTEIWKDWQTLTAAMIALSASIIVFHATQYKEEKQRQRDFVAEKAFLPEVFSEMTSYLIMSAAYIREAERKRSASDFQTVINLPLPTLSGKHKEIFRNCIRKADDNFSKVLFYMLMHLQTHQNRMSHLQKCFGTQQNHPLPAGFFISYLFRAAQLQGIINKNYDYIRGLKEYEPKNMTWEHFSSGLDTVGFNADEIDDFERFVKDAMNREKRII